MAEELEIKLTVAEPDLNRVALWASARSDARYEAEQALFNRYYDTPDAVLNRQQAALRVRRLGMNYVQTLKTRGDFVAGAHRRQEWEWPLSSANLDVSLLAETPLASVINLERLSVVFETNFRRRTWRLNHWDAEVEMALDEGAVVSGSRRSPLCEVEFELKSGASGRLLELAMALAGQVPVFLNLVSKAEQGYFLAGMHRPVLAPSDASLSVTDFLHLLGLAWMLEVPVPIARLRLDTVADAAERVGQGAAFQWVVAELAAGRLVRSLARETALGQLQLSLAAV